jgi:hypothetical protein
MESGPVMMTLATVGELGPAGSFELGLSQAATRATSAIAVSVPLVTRSCRIGSSG